MKINDIATAAQSLANYCYREGEAADLERIDGALLLMEQRLTVLKHDRISAMVDDHIERMPLGE
jgi:hypothetical protein